MYKVVDNIAGEEETFANQYDAELDANVRLNIYNNKAILVYNPKNKTYEITVGGR